MTIDYETEYNNRARVPEHPEIFAGWARDAAAYRDQASAEGRAELGLRYGPGPRQTIDLLCPEGGRAAPVALFIHGGWWRSLEPASFSHMARGLNAHGFVVAVPGYDLCPQVSIAEIIDQARQACLYLWRRFGRRLLVSGHSAGGHLAACMTATDWKSLAPDVPADLVPAAFAISGLFDLTMLTGISVNADLRLTDDTARACSPLYWRPPAGHALDAWYGGAESSEFHRQSRVMAEAWGKAGVQTDCREAAGENHFTVIAPLADPASGMVARLVALGERAQLAAA
jgi:arylformamidase